MRTPEENVTVLAPFAIPFHQYKLVRLINRFLLNVQMKHAIAQLKLKDKILWAYNPFIAEVTSGIDFKLKIYHCVDDFKFAPGIPQDEVMQSEERLIKSADLVFTSSRGLQRRCATLNPKNTSFFPNVVDYERFRRPLPRLAEPIDLKSIPHPRIGFAGSMSEYKVDLDLIVSVARNNPDWHWVIITEVGEVQSTSAFQSLNLPNIHILKIKSLEELPTYFHYLDVATLPCTQNKYTESMFPLRFFEYLASGLPVVATPLPAIDEFSNYFLKAANASEFQERVLEALSGNHPPIEAGVHLAKRFTWESRFNLASEQISNRLQSK